MMIRTHRRVAICVVLLLCSVVLAGERAHAVVADGALGDIRALPWAVEIVDTAGGTNGVQDSPIAPAQLIDLGGGTVPSGFNIGSMVVAYDPFTDAYYFGTDVSCLPSDDTIFITASVAWDSDGDGSPDIASEGPLFVNPAINDDDPTPLGGEREEYRLIVDIGNDGVPDFQVQLIDVGNGPELDLGALLGVPLADVQWGTGDDVEIVILNVSVNFPRSSPCDYYTVGVDGFADTQADDAEEHYVEVFDLPLLVQLCKEDFSGVGVPAWLFDVTITPVGGAPYEPILLEAGDGCYEFFAPQGSTIEVCETLPQDSFEAFVEARVNGVAVTPDPAGPDTFCITTPADCPLEIVFKNAAADFNILKDCVITFDPEMTIHWEVVVTNTGEVALDIHVVDPVAGIDEWVLGLLSGDSETITASRLVAPEECDTVIANLATATGYLADTEVEIGTEEDGAGCLVPCFGCLITKTCEITYDPELTIHWVVEVCNTGDVVQDMHVVDAVAGIDEVLLAMVPGECRIIETSRLVDPATEPCGTVISNTATVIGYIPGTLTEVCFHEDTTECIVPCCEWTIDKSCEVLGEPGAQTITWTVEVCNLPTSTCVIDIHVVDPDVGIDQVELEVFPGECRTITVGPEPMPCDTPVENEATGTAFISGTDISVGLPQSDTSDCRSDPCDGGPTRTPGYWFTHPTALNAAFDCITGSELGTIDLTDYCGDCLACEACAVDANDAMAVFWSIKGSNRPTLGQHILAALFNQCLFGTSPGGDIIADGIAVLCNPNATSEEIGAVIGPLDEFNNSGDDLPFPDGTTWHGRANPRMAKGMAAAGTAPDCVQ